MHQQLAVAIAAALAMGCDAPEPTSDAGPRTPTYYQDTKPILDAYCTRCHVEGGIAPFALGSYEQVEAVSMRIPPVIEARAMPPFLAAPAVRPLRYDTSLSDEQIARITEWVELGAPMGDPGAEAPPIELPTRQLDRVDRVLTMAEPYAPRVHPDDYRCFVLDWPDTEPTYVTGVELMPDNELTAHHAVVYLVEEANAAPIDAADGADGAPGYPCFGGASPDGEGAFPAKMVGAWTPGVEALPYPEGTGMRIEPGTRVVLQMHYSALDPGAAPDQSSVAFQTADSVDLEAGYLPWLDLSWPSDPATMTIPAGDDSVVHEYVADPTESPLLGTFVPGMDPSAGLVIHSVLPHMHKLGTAISLQVEREDGSVEPIVRIDRWDFDWQAEYTLRDPITVRPGDRVRIRCEWDNSERNQPVIGGVRRDLADVMWGEGTYDEMCAASMYVYAASVVGASCEDLGTVPADTGRFLARFDASDSVRTSPSLEGELRGLVRGTIWRDEDVGLTGPADGAESVGRFQIDDLDLRAGPSDPIEIEVDLPAGDYQILGFMDTDGNIDPVELDPDVNDPVMIPGRAHRLECARQPIEVTFPLLLPDR